MKIIRLFLIGLMFVSFQACDEADESFETTAQINVDIPLTAWYVNVGEELKAGSDGEYQFNGSAAFCLANKEGLSKCPGSVTGVVPGTGAELSFETLAGDQEINTLMLEWGYSSEMISDFKMQNPVELLRSGESLTKVRFTITVDELLEPVISRMDNSPGVYIVIGLSGEANFDASITATLSVPVIVESIVVSPRFTL